MSGVGNEKNRGGRPRHRDEVKRASLTFRTLPSTREALERAASANGLSLAQEIERRLELSVEQDTINRDPRTAALFAQILSDVAEIEDRTGQHWHKDLKTFGAVRSAVQDALSDAMPTPADLREDVQSAVEALSALRTQNALVASSPPPWLSPSQRKKWEDAARSFDLDEATIAVDQKVHNVFAKLEAIATEGERLFADIREERESASRLRAR